MGLNVCLNKAVVHCQREKCTTADTRAEESVVSGLFLRHFHLKTQRIKLYKENTSI